MTLLAQSVARPDEAATAEGLDQLARKSGGYVTTDADGRAVAAVFLGQGITDDVMTRIAKLKQLESLVVAKAAITDAGLCGAPLKLDQDDNESWTTEGTRSCPDN